MTVRLTTLEWLQAAAGKRNNIRTTGDLLTIVLRPQRQPFDYVMSKRAFADESLLVLRRRYRPICNLPIPINRSVSAQSGYNLFP